MGSPASAECESLDGSDLNDLLDDKHRCLTITLLCMTWHGNVSMTVERQDFGIEPHLTLLRRVGKERRDERLMRIEGEDTLQLFVKLAVLEHEECEPVAEHDRLQDFEVGYPCRRGRTLEKIGGNGRYVKAAFVHEIVRPLKNSPLFRWLECQVGRPWDQVYSDLCNMTRRKGRSIRLKRWLLLKLRQEKISRGRKKDLFPGDLYVNDAGILSRK